MRIPDILAKRRARAKGKRLGRRDPWKCSSTWCADVDTRPKWRVFAVQKRSLGRCFPP